MGKKKGKPTSDDIVSGLEALLLSAHVQYDVVDWPKGLVENEALKALAHERLELPADLPSDAFMEEGDEVAEEWKQESDEWFEKWRQLADLLREAYPSSFRSRGEAGAFIDSVLTPFVESVGDGYIRDQIELNDESRRQLREYLRSVVAGQLPGQYKVHVRLVRLHKKGLRIAPIDLGDDHFLNQPRTGELGISEDEGDWLWVSYFEPGWFMKPRAKQAEKLLSGLIGLLLAEGLVSTAGPPSRRGGMTWDDWATYFDLSKLGEMFPEQGFWKERFPETEKETEVPEPEKGGKADWPYFPAGKHEEETSRPLTYCWGVDEKTKETEAGGTLPPDFDHLHRRLFTTEKLISVSSDQERFGLGRETGESEVAHNRLEVLSGIVEKGEDGQRLLRSASWYTMATYSHDLVNQAIFTFVAFEALLGGDWDARGRERIEGVTDRLADRVGFLMEDVLSKRIALKNEFKKWYGVRSDLVHGRIAATEVKEEKKTIAEVRDLLKKAISKELHGLTRSR